MGSGRQANAIAKGLASLGMGISIRGSGEQMLSMAQGCVYMQQQTSTRVGLSSCTLLCSAVMPPTDRQLSQLAETLCRRLHWAYPRLMTSTTWMHMMHT